MILQLLLLLMIATGKSKTSKRGGFFFNFRNSRPYTLDYGLANDCWNNVCGTQLKLPGKIIIMLFLQ
jgi:hypothetical protein